MLPCYDVSIFRIVAFVVNFWEKLIFAGTKFTKTIANTNIKDLKIYLETLKKDFLS